MKILVTGGAGFIGSHIVDGLVEQGHDVVIIDNLTSGHRDNINSKAKFYEIDITSDKLTSVFEEFKPEFVVHHAAQINVQKSLLKPILDLDINVKGTLNLLAQSKNVGVRKFIYASSAAVYGIPEYLPVDENHPVSPISFYGISKHTPEHYIQVYSELYNLDFTIFRYANVYGTRQDAEGEGGVVSIFLDRLTKGIQPSIFGDGCQTRDFIFVKDIVSANIAALYRGSRGIFNISTNYEISINQLLEVLTNKMDVVVSPNYQPGKQGDIHNSRLCNKRAFDILNWKPQYSIYRGLEEVIDSYKIKNTLC